MGAGRVRVREWAMKRIPMCAVCWQRIENGEAFVGLVDGPVAHPHCLAKDPKKDAEHNGASAIREAMIEPNPDA